MENQEDNPQVPSAKEREGMMFAKPGSPLGELGLARNNARVLLRLRFPGFSFRLRARKSSNGDVQTLDVKWPAVPGAPSEEDVSKALFPFWSMAAQVRPSDDGMPLVIFQSQYGQAHIMNLVPRPPTPEELLVAMHRQLPPAAASAPKVRF